MPTGIREYLPMNTDQQQFLRDLDKQRWVATDCLRFAVNPSKYMHVVFGLGYGI